MKYEHQRACRPLNIPFGERNIRWALFFRRNPDKVKISERREDAECDERKANLMCASFAGILVWSPRRYAMIAFGVCCAASNFAARRFYRGNRQA
jgi:hypothetical protein